MTLNLILRLCVAAALFATDGDRTIRYNRNTEVTVVGVLQDASEMSEPPELSGVHFALRVEKEKPFTDVYIAPRQFLQDLGIKFSQGKEIQIKGSKVRWAGADVVLAREVRWNGTEMLTLRDDDGNPFW